MEIIGRFRSQLKRSIEAIFLYTSVRVAPQKGKTRQIQQGPKTIIEGT